MIKTIYSIQNLYIIQKLCDNSDQKITSDELCVLTNNQELFDITAIFKKRNIYFPSTNIQIESFTKKEMMFSASSSPWVSCRKCDAPFTVTCLA